MKKFSLLAIIAALTVSSCSPQYGPGQGAMGTGFSKQQVGTVLGGIGGGIAGNQFGKGKGNTAATIGGALLGSMIGNSVGQSLDRADMQYLNSTTQGSLESTTTGTVSRWLNPDSGNSGTVTPTRTFQNGSGQYCREFSQAIVVGGEKQNAFGTACRQPDGAWQIVSN
jgi:surface antigen